MRIIREHILAFTCALIFGLLLAGPYLYFAFHAESTPVIYPELVNDQDFYLSRIQDVRDGYPSGGNTYLSEHKDARPVQILVGEIVSATIFDFLHINTETGVIVLQLLFPPIIFLLTYAIALACGAPRAWALTGTIFLCVGSMFFLFARPISPQFNFIFWLIAVWGSFKLAENPHWKWALFQSLAIGSLFYLYPYYWTHIGASYAVLVAITFFTNKKIALWTCISGIGAIIVGSGYLVTLLATRSDPNYIETLERLGGVYTRFPSGAVFAISSAILIAAIMYIAWRLKKGTPALFVALSLVVGGVLAMNQHLITGFTLEFASHYKMQIQFANIFFALTAISAFGWWPLLKARHALRSAIVFTTLIVLISVIPPYITSYNALADNGERDSHAPIIAWLKENAEKNAVVYAEENLAKIIPAYTSLDVFYARNANLFLMPESEATERAILQNYRATYDDAFFVDAERELFGQRYMNTYQQALLQQKAFRFLGIQTLTPERIPASVVQRVRTQAETFRALPFQNAIAPYRIDYLAIKKNASDRLTEKDLEYAQLVFETDAYAIYKTK